MKEIDEIIAETIDSYLNENLLLEKKKQHNEYNNKNNKKHVRKKAIKGKGGLRKDLDIEDEEKYNQNVDDMEQSSVKDMLTNGYFNIKKVAEKLYPDHTPEGAQSQLNKKLTGAKSDSGSTYRLKKKELKRLRHILSTII